MAIFIDLFNLLTIKKQNSQDVLAKAGQGKRSFHHDKQLN